MVFVTEGRQAKTVAEFASYLKEHNGAPEQIARAIIDMSPAFINGIAEYRKYGDVITSCNSSKENN